MKILSLIFNSIGSVLDIGGVLNRPEYLDRSDEEALREDWEKVGGDMQRAIESYENQGS